MIFAIPAASLMLINGIPAIVVSKILGHAKPSTTTTLYGHLVPDGQQAAAKVIDEIAAPIPVNIEPTPLVDQPFEKHVRISKNDKHG